MSTALLLTLVVLGQPKADPDQFPLALHRSMELDDIDRELQRLHDSVLMKRGRYAGTQRLAQRGLISRSDVEAESADLRYEEAREAEMISFKALKAYERDVMGRVIESDEVKAYSLLLDWLKKQEAMTQVDFDHCEYTLDQTRKLYQRKAISRQELEDAELSRNTARATLALNQSRQAQVVMELTARRGEKSYDPSESARLKADYLKARVRHCEIITEGAKSRLLIATERSRRGMIPPNELGIFQKAVEDAGATLATERRKLADAEAEAKTASARTR